MTDDELFEKVLCNPHHVLYNSLPNQIVSFFVYCIKTYISHTFLYDFTITFSRLFRILHFIVVTLRFVKVL